MKYIYNVLLFSPLLFLSSCYCSQFAGVSFPNIKNGYFRHSTPDTNYYIEKMNAFGQNFPLLPLRRTDYCFENVKEHFGYVEAIRRIRDTMILIPTYSIKTTADKYGFAWCIKSTKNDLVYVLKLNYEGLGLSAIYEVKNDTCLMIKTSDLCQLPHRERRRLRKYYIHRFEEEILPLLKPYFEKKE